MSAGWQPEQFSEPQAFLSYVKVHRPTVAIIDVWMPLMNGLEVQSRLRELSPSTRVIMFTGKEDPLVRSTSLKAGASAFFHQAFRRRGISYRDSAGPLRDVMASGPVLSWNDKFRLDLSVKIVYSNTGS